MFKWIVKGVKWVATKVAKNPELAEAILDAVVAAKAKKKEQ